MKPDTSLFDVLQDLGAHERLSPSSMKLSEHALHAFERYLQHTAVVADLTDANLSGFKACGQSERLVGWTQETIQRYLGRLKRLRRYSIRTERRSFMPQRATLGKRLRGDSTGPTVATVVEMYIEHAERYYVKDGQQTTEVRMIKDAVAIPVERFGEMSAAHFGPKSLKVCCEGMIQKDWCRTHINRQMERIKRVFKWAASEELVPGSVYESLRCVSGLRRGRTAARESKPVRFVADSVVDATLPHLPDVVADMVRLQRVTGMRPSEVCILRPMDIDRSGADWLYTPGSHKTEHHGKARVILIGPQGQRVLQKYLDRPADRFCFDPADTDKARRAKLSRMFSGVFSRKAPAETSKRTPNRSKPSKFAPRYNARTYGCAVRRAAVRAGCEVWSPNRLRHSFATSVRKKYGLEAAQVLLGHASAEVTQVYAQRDHELAARVIRQVG